MLDWSDEGSVITRGDLASAGSDAERSEIHADHPLVELAADAGREEVVLALVGKGDLGRGVAHERVVDPGVGDGASETGLARGRASSDRRGDRRGGDVDAPRLASPSRKSPGSTSRMPPPPSTARSQGAPGVSMRVQYWSPGKHSTWTSMPIAARLLAMMYAARRLAGCRAAESSRAQLCDGRGRRGDGLSRRRV